jgi:putative ABC transport system permease protein
MYFITFIAKNLFRRPGRTVLTIIGLAVAIGAVIALLGISDNVKRSVASSFDQRRIDLVVTQAGRSTGLNSDFRQWFVDRVREMPDVEAVSEAVVNLIDVTRETGYSDQVMIQGWRPDNFAFDDIQIITGRKIEEGDKQVVMLGSTLAQNLNKKVGDTVVFGAYDPTNLENQYKVIGIYKSAIVFEDGGAILPLEEARKLTGMNVTGFSVRVKKPSPDSSAEIDAVKTKIEALRDPEDPSVRLNAQTPQSYVDSVSQLKLVNAISWLVSAIGLIVGVIGMLNTMVMSVIERTQEIGILRAVGWPPRRVMAMVLGESLLLGLAAAILGTVGAILATHVLTLFPQVNGFIEGGIAPNVIVEGLIFTVAIGLLGGAYPAFRAARLLPTEAIRHE